MTRYIHQDPESVLKKSFEAQAYTPEEQEFLLDFFRQTDSGTLADHQISALALNAGLVDPFSGEKRQDEEQAFSWGLSEDGYDMRLGTTFQFYRRKSGAVIDPRRLSAGNLFKKFEGNEILLPPGGFVLGVTMERVRLPSFIRAHVENKSTLARLGIDASFNTSVRPGAQGLTTLEIKNRNELPVILRAGEGIVSFRFEMLSAPVMNGYNGRYAGQDAAAGPYTGSFVRGGARFSLRGENSEADANRPGPSP